jgi:hypothetical protein
VWRAPGLSASFSSAALVATIAPSTVFTDTSAAASTAYTYFLKAVNAAGASSASSGASVTTSAAGTGGGGGGGGGPVTFVLSVGAQGTSSGAGPTSGANTAAANMLVACVSSNAGSTITLTDSYGNTWTPLTASAFTGAVQTQIYVCLTPTVGTGHTFQVSGAGTYPSFCVMAFSGFSGITRGQNGASGTTSPLSPGSVTPPSNGALVVYALGSSFGSGSVSVDVGTIAQNLGFVGGTSYAGAFAYEIQTTAAPIAPSWTFSPSYPYAAASIACFV